MFTTSCHNVDPFRSTKWLLKNGFFQFFVKNELMSILTFTSRVLLLRRLKFCRQFCLKRQIHIVLITYVISYFSAANYKRLGT
jgi:hypothetical protein